MQRDDGLETNKQTKLSGWGWDTSLLVEIKVVRYAMSLLFQNIMREGECTEPFKLGSFGSCGNYSKRKLFQKLHTSDSSPKQCSLFSYEQVERAMSS